MTIQQNWKRIKLSTLPLVLWSSCTLPRMCEKVSSWHFSIDHDKINIALAKFIDQYLEWICHRTLVRLLTVEKPIIPEACVSGKASCFHQKSRPSGEKMDSCPEWDELPSSAMKVFKGKNPRRSRWRISGNDQERKWDSAFSCMVCRLAESLLRR